MGVFKDIFKNVPEDSIFVAQWRELKGRPVLGAEETVAVQQLQRLQTSLASTRHAIIHQVPLRQAAIEQQVFTIRKAFNQNAQPKSLFTRGLEFALGGKDVVDLYETSIPEIDTVAQDAQKIRQQLESGVKLRDVKKEIHRINDAAFDVTLRLARVQEAVKRQPPPKPAAEEPGFAPFGFSQRLRLFGFS